MSEIPRCTYHQPNEPKCGRVEEDPVHVRVDERMRPGGHVFRSELPSTRSTKLRSDYERGLLSRLQRRTEAQVMKRNKAAEAAVGEALRCTEHIPERDIRAMYIVTQLRLDGWVLQEANRDPRGRFVASR